MQPFSYFTKDLFGFLCSGVFREHHGFLPKSTICIIQAHFAFYNDVFSFFTTNSM